MKIAANNRGMSLGINTVVILVIVFIVLVVVAGFFLGGFNQIGGGITGLSDEAKNESPGIGTKIKDALGLWGDTGNGNWICSGGTFNCYTDVIGKANCDLLVAAGRCTPYNSYKCWPSSTTKQCAGLTESQCNAVTTCEYVPE